MDLTLSRLEYLSGPHSNGIYTAFEKLNKELEAIFEDITRMEGLLAKEGVDPHRLMASGEKIIKNLKKAVDKFGAIGGMSISMEYTMEKAQFICDSLDEGKSLSDSEKASMGKLDLPMYNQYRKIVQEVMRRTTACNNELSRKIHALETELSS